MAMLFGLHPFLLTLYADGGYQEPGFRKGLMKAIAQVNGAMVKRPDPTKGLAVPPTRRIVEHTFAWLE